MNDTHDVISDFLDGRTFELADLARALDVPDGRALLIDSLAVRRLVQPTDPIPQLSLPLPQSHLWLRSTLAAAALVAAVVSGYVVGTRHTPVGVTEAPEPTRVVQVVSTGQDLRDGGRR
jgi:hypothetical protein